MTVTVVNGLENFHNIIKGAEYSVFDFWAPWCGPCRTISPVFAKLAEQYPNIKFYKVDTDEEEAISEEVQIRALPHFILYKDGKPVSTATGAVPRLLEELLNKAPK